MGTLTNKQRKIVDELEKITELAGLDYSNILRFEKDARTPVLESIKDQIIRGEVILNYTLVDEHLNLVLADYFFGKGSNYTKLWKTKKFQNFNYFILEKLYLLNKLDLAKNIIDIPLEIENIIRKMNNLRNGLAHSFFPKNLKRNKPIYNKKDIYSLDGFHEYVNDFEKVNKFFFEKIFKIKITLPHQ